MKEVFGGSRQSKPRFVRLGQRQRSPEAEAPAPPKLTRSIKPLVHREQIRRLARLVKDLDKKIDKLPPETQKRLRRGHDEHRIAKQAGEDFAAQDKARY